MGTAATTRGGMNLASAWNWLKHRKAKLTISVTVPFAVFVAVITLAPSMTVEKTLTFAVATLALPKVVMDEIEKTTDFPSWSDGAKDTLRLTRFSFAALAAMLLWLAAFEAN